MFQKIKEKLNIFKNSRAGGVLFFICAFFPFLLTDFILRFVLNFVIINDIKYYAVPWIFNILWIFAILQLCRTLPRLLGKILYSIVYIFFGILFFVNYIYFCFFNQFMWLRAVLLAGEGMNYAKDALVYVTPTVLRLAVLYILFLTITLWLWRPCRPKKKSKKYVLLILPFLLLMLLHGAIMVDTKIQVDNGAWEIWDRPVLIYREFTDANKSLNVCGFYQYTFKSIYREIVKENPYNTDDQMDAEMYFTGQQSYPDNEMTGILKDKNVIFVLMESLDDWLITDRYTPTIKYMMRHGINFTNFYMPNVGSGYTFNAEFAMNTGFYCPQNASSASIYTSNIYPNAMANLFKNQGYNPNSFHFNSRHFYNRESMHTKFGFNKYYSLMNYMPIEECVQDSCVPLTDSVYEKMTEDKFFSFFISYSCHLPYDTMDNKLIGAMEDYPDMIDEGLDEESKNIRLLAYDTDRFFKYLLERLYADGLLEDTVIIGVADHYAYGLKDKERLEEYTKAAGSDIYEKVPFFIWSPSIRAREVNKVIGGIDILPTVANLFDLDEKGYFLGNDAFNPEYAGFVYFEDGSWFDGKIRYFPTDDPLMHGNHNLQYIEEMNRQVVKMMKINDYVVNSNFFKNVRK